MTLDDLSNFLISFFEHFLAGIEQEQLAGMGMGVLQGLLAMVHKVDIPTNDVVNFGSKSGISIFFETGFNRFKGCKILFQDFVLVVAMSSLAFTRS